MDSQSTAVAPVPQPERHEQAGQQLPAVVTEDGGDGFIARWSANVPMTFTNLDQRGPQGMALITRALAVADRKTRNVVNQELTLVGYVAHRAEVVDSVTGECVTKDRAVMILADGGTVSTMSGGVLRTLAYLSRVMGLGRWTPGVKVMVREHPLDGGKSYCDMIVVDSPAAEVVTGKRTKG